MIRVWQERAEPKPPSADVQETKQCQSYDDMIIEKLRQAQDDFDNSVDLIETAINMINAAKQV